MMLRNRLAELLSERGLKITKVAKDTGISRNTITSTSQNDSKMIQYETIDTLCRYLNITPNELFQYQPIKFDYTIATNEISFSYGIDPYAMFDRKVIHTVFEFDLYIDIENDYRVETISMSGKVINAENGIDSDSLINIELNFDSEEDLSNFKTITQEIYPAFKIQIEKEITNIIRMEFEARVDEEYSDLTLNGLLQNTIIFIEVKENKSWLFKMPF